MKEIRIIDRVISEKSSIFFIAEIGINHNGSVELAKKLIDMAVFCGADSVKFQKRTPEISVPVKFRNKIVETPWGRISYLDYRQRIEFNEEEYKEINQYCKERNIPWIASVWDIPSLKFIEQFSVPFHKIASAKLTDKELLKEIKKTEKPVFLSTGMSTEEEIKEAVRFFGNDYPLGILHCCSEYPTKDENLNLSYIKRLQKKFPNYIIGYSGHEEGIIPSIISASLGARIIERHITLDRSMWGSDQNASIEVIELCTLIKNLRKVPIWIGDGKKRVTDAEKKIKNKLR